MYRVRAVGEGYGGGEVRLPFADIVDLAYWFNRLTIFTYAGETWRLIAWFGGRLMVAWRVK